MEFSGPITCRRDLSIFDIFYFKSLVKVATLSLDEVDNVNRLFARKSLFYC